MTDDHAPWWRCPSCLARHVIVGTVLGLAIVGAIDIAKAVL